MRHCASSGPPPCTTPVCALTQTRTAPVSDALKNDADVVLTAVGHGFQALNFAAPALKNDKRVCLAAVTANGRALQMLAGTTMAGNAEVVKTAVTQQAFLLKFAAEKLKGDLAFLKECAAANPEIAKYVPRELAAHFASGGGGGGESSRGGGSAGGPERNNNRGAHRPDPYRGHGQSGGSGWRY